MPENPLNVIKSNDPEFFKLVDKTREFALSESGALPLKVKFLIALALDASKGAEGGVTYLSGEAMKAGATKQEIMEALRVTQYVCGVGSTYTAGRGLKNVF